MNDLTSTLAALPLLEGLAPQHLESLAQQAVVAVYEPESVLFREGEPATCVHLVLKGHAALEMCAPGVGCRRILTAGEGEILGWSPLLAQPRLVATARAITAVETVRLPARAILALCEQDPEFGYELMRRVALALSRRLSAARLQLVNVYGDGMPHAAAFSEEPPS